MPTIRNTVQINASPDEVWSVLGDLAATHRWVPGIVAAAVDGHRRVCTTADDNEVLEEIYDYSTETRSYRYQQNKVPLPVRNSRGRLEVRPDGSRAVVAWEAEFDVPDATQEAEVTGMIDGYYKQTLKTLRNVVEETSTLNQQTEKQIMANPFVWFDLRTNDSASARDFYGELLGWPVRDVPMGRDEPIPIFGDGDRPWGLIAPTPRSGPSHWLPYVQVEDVEAATANAKRLGGTVVQERIDGPAGWYSIVADPTGATLALWQSKPAP